MVFRRAIIGVAALASGGVWPTAGLAQVSRPADPGIDEEALVRRFTGGSPVPSTQVRLAIPAKFQNGYSVPVSISVDCPMTEAEYVRALHLLAPLNPIVPVASFSFTPASGRASVTTRIRLAKTQTVLAVAEINDGSWLMARARVAVETDGCA